MNLTVTNVGSVMKECLSGSPDLPNQKIVDGIINKFSFNPLKLAEHYDDIHSMLSQLPETFHADCGGGWSFLNMCTTADGQQWGEHIHMEMLLALGIATGQAQTLLPRDMWHLFPGSMPYITIFPKLEDSNVENKPSIG